MKRVYFIAFLLFWSLCILSSAAMEQVPQGDTKDGVNKQDEKGLTTLHKVVNTLGRSKENVQTVRDLLEHGADVRIANNKGNTPVHCAVKEMFKPVVNAGEGKMLLQLLYIPSGSIVEKARERVFCLLCCFTRYNNSQKNTYLKISKDLRKLFWGHVMRSEILREQLGVLQHVLQHTNKKGYTPLQLAKMCIQKMQEDYAQLAQQYHQAEGFDTSIKEVGEGLQELLDPQKVAQSQEKIAFEAQERIKKMLQKK